MPGLMGCSDGSQQDTRGVHRGGGAFRRTDRKRGVLRVPRNLKRQWLWCIRHQLRNRLCHYLRRIQRFGAEMLSHSSRLLRGRCR